jgi:potassium/hydrogen antiporter
MDTISLYILVGSSLLIASVLTSLISSRIGAPLLLVFLGIGLFAGQDGPLGIQFNNAPLGFLLGSMALAVILFDSGFNTQLRTIRVAAWPAVTLATIGVALTTGLMGIGAKYLLDVSWLNALLIGAIVSSTDAAAVFFLLRVGGINIRERVRSTLEIESGSNDPMAIFLTVSLVELISADANSVSWGLGLDFLRQMGGGAALGSIGGLLIPFTFNRLRLEMGLYPVLSLAMALFIFAVTNIVGASGFLAAYIAGLIAGNTRLRAAARLRSFYDGVTWLSQIIMFVTLGLLATPSDFPTVAAPAFALALVLIFFARPVAVWLCLLPFRFSYRETTFIAWVGLRGAVSILLAIVPILGGLDAGQMFFNFVFMIVVASLLVQGWTIRRTARWLGLIEPNDESRTQKPSEWKEKS